MIFSIFITIYNSIFNIYYYVWSIFFTIVKIYGIKNNNKYNLYTEYLLLKFLLLFGIKINTTTYDYIKIELYNDITRNILCSNANLYNVIIDINKIKYDINELTMNKKCITTNISLNDISIKDLIEHYSDKSKIFNHTIKNLLSYKNITYNENNDELIITYFQGKKNIKKLFLKNIINIHISDLYE